jgi:hypothetical protein
MRTDEPGFTSIVSVDGSVTLANATWWINTVVTSQAKQLPSLIDSIRSGRVEKGTGPVYTLPLALRYVPSPDKDTGTENERDEALDGLDKLNLQPGEYLGNLHFEPGPPAEVGNSPVDEIDQTWVASWDVSPKLQKRGIGGTMLKAGLEAWIEWMGVKRVIAVSESIASHLISYLYPRRTGIGGHVARCSGQMAYGRSYKGRIPRLRRWRRNAGSKRQENTSSHGRKRKEEVRGWWSSGHGRARSK